MDVFRHSLHYFIIYFTLLKFNPIIDILIFIIKGNSIKIIIINYNSDIIINIFITTFTITQLLPSSSPITPLLTSSLFYATAITTGTTGITTVATRISCLSTLYKESNSHKRNRIRTMANILRSKFRDKLLLWDDRHSHIILPSLHSTGHYLHRKNKWRYTRHHRTHTVQFYNKNISTQDIGPSIVSRTRIIPKIWPENRLV